MWPLVLGEARGLLNCLFTPNRNQIRYACAGAIAGCLDYALNEAV